MSDLIDREELLRKMEERYSKIDNGRAFKGMTIPVVDGVRMNEIEYCIGMIQSEDVIEAKRHGKWNYKWDAELDPKRLFVRIVCSECNLHTGQKSNYCPKCGAKMDGGVEDD